MIARGFMSFFRVSFFYVLLCLHFQLSTKDLVMQRSVSSSVLTIHGKEFEHIKKSENGVHSEQFCIKGVPVEKDQYYEQLHAARASAMHDEQQEVERKEHERSLLRDGVQRALLEKLMITLVQDLVQDIQILENSALQPYLFF